MPIIRNIVDTRRAKGNFMKNNKENAKGLIFFCVTIVQTDNSREIENVTLLIQMIFALSTVRQ